MEMFAHLGLLFFLTMIAIAMPLNCRGPSDDETYLGLNIRTGNVSEQSTEYFFSRRFKHKDCPVMRPQPAVRLTSFPNTGTTWLQFLMEEATKIATQNPQSIIVHAGRPFLFPSDPVFCRAECGGHLYLDSNCTANSSAADGIRLATGEEPEIFKNHYPDFTEPFALFETDYEMKKTIALVRNPIDAYLAQKRHIPANTGEKINVEDNNVPDERNVGVGSLGNEYSGTNSELTGHGAVNDARANGEPDKPDNHTLTNESVCPYGFAHMRNETFGHGVDPLGISLQEPIRMTHFAEFLDNWRNFFDFWFTHPAVACTELVIVHYEDLATQPESILEHVVGEVGMLLSGDDAIERAVGKFPVDTARLSYNVYFNKTYYANKTMQAWANYSLNTYGRIIERLGYAHFLRDVRDFDIDEACDLAD